MLGLIFGLSAGLWAALIPWRFFVTRELCFESDRLRPTGPLGDPFAFIIGLGVTELVPFSSDIDSVRGFIVCGSLAWMVGVLSPLGTPWSEAGSGSDMSSMCSSGADPTTTVPFLENSPSMPGEICCFCNFMRVAGVATSLMVVG